MTRIIPYLSVDSAMKALELYQNIFDVKEIERVPVTEEQRSMFGIPEDTDLSKTTMHGEFVIDGNLLFIADNFSGEISEKSNISILIETETLERAQSIFANAKNNNCKITEEFRQMFWGDYFGSFSDPFGISWQLNFSPDEE